MELLQNINLDFINIMNRNVLLDIYDENQVINVAAYARVSTDHEDQRNSFEAQKEYFENCIKEHKNWRFCGVYADEGISGTSTKKRAEFNRMISDAEQGKFNLILTKEVSRFARNTVDVLVYTRRLKAKNVGVFFLLDNLNTFRDGDEVMLTIKALFAQDESRKTSERVTWGHQQRMKKGVVYGRDMLGYRVNGGKLELVDDEAEIVRKIFTKYTIEGKGTHVIARELQEEGIMPMNPDGIAKYKNNWSNTVILRILRNEKYVGDLRQQKTITVDYLTHKKVYNKGEKQFIEIKDHHPEIAIISRQLWDKTQEELNRRSEQMGSKEKYSNRYWTSGLVVCGECNSSYIHNLRKRKDGSTYSTIACFSANNHGGKKEVNGEVVGCDNGTVNAQVLSTCVNYIVNFLLKNKDELLKEMKEEIKNVFSADVPTVDRKSIEDKIERYQNKITDLIDLLLDNSITKDEMLESKKQYNEKIDKLKARLLEVDNVNELRKRQAGIIEEYMTEIKKLIAFDAKSCNESVYREIVKKIVVFKNKELHFYLYCLPMAIKIVYDTHGKMDKYTVDIVSMEMVENA